MHLRYRRLYFATLTLVFLLSAPILVWYAMGWRVDPGNKQLTLSGSLTLVTTPERASVSINGASAGETPIKARRLVPGTYELSVQKNGWVTYTENISIQSGHATVIKDLELIRSEGEPTTIQQGRIAFISQDPSRRYLILEVEQGAGSEIVLLTDDSTTKSSVYSLRNAEHLQRVVWNRNSSLAALKIVQADSVSIFSLALKPGSTLEQVSLPNSFAAREAMWDDSQTDQLYIASQREVISVTSGLRAELPEDSLSVLVNNANIYSATRTQNDVVQIVTQEMNTSKESILFTGLPSTSDIDLHIEDKKLFVHDVTHSTLSVFTLDHPTQAPEMYSQVSQFAFNRETGDLLLSNSHELYVARDGSSTVVARYADTIISPIWLDKKHLLYILGGSLHIAYLERSPVVILLLYPLTSDRILLNEKNTALFVSSDNGLSRITLKD